MSASSIVKPGNGIIFMKVGTHAGEVLDEIVERKLKEFGEAGVIFWGYGGNTCHPLSYVQPFAKECVASGHKIYLIMQPMDSKHFAEPKIAEEYSDDGVTWKKVPQGVQVRGSRYALVLNSLERDDFEIDLGQLRVALGACKGKLGADYVRGRVDKGCFLVDPGPLNQTPDSKPIGLTASVRRPYAVLLK